MTNNLLRTKSIRGDQTWTDVTNRVAAIYGANASGKTTVLEGIWALAHAIQHEGSGAIYQPMADSSSEESVNYSVDFIASNTRYQYEVKAASWGIEYEALHAFPKGSKRRIFVREQRGKEAEIQFFPGDTLRGPNAEVKRMTRSISLYLATAYKYQHEGLEGVAAALAAQSGVNFLTYRDKQDDTILREFLLELLGRPDDQTPLVSALLQAGDLGLAEAEIRQEKVPKSVLERMRRLIGAITDENEPIPPELVPDIAEVLVFHHKGAHDQKFTLPLKRESSGTISWIVSIWQALTALREGSLLLIDELDASLHPSLARYIVELFLTSHLNPKGAQLVFTTHDISLLGNSPTRLLESSDVWFTEKNSTGKSTLFSLNEFDTRSRNNFERQYLAGRFGAVPSIDDSLLLEFISSGVTDVSEQ
jgi:AAA15 family ATPase/GTPase